MADYWELNQQEEGRGLSAGAVRYSYDEAEWAAFPVSAILKTYREAYGLSLQDVSDALKIKMQYLIAIEQEITQPCRVVPLPLVMSGR